VWNGSDQSGAARRNGEAARPRYRGRFMEVEQRLRERADRLTPAERRIAAIVLAGPQIVAFGTVAELAEAAGAGTATVVRFSVKLGYDGWSELQASVRRDLTGQLRPAVERIRDEPPTDGQALLRSHLEAELSNVRTTLEGVDVDALEAAVALVADVDRPVLVLSGVASRGVAVQFVGDLEQLRPACRLLDGNPIDIVRTLALAGADATVVALDLRRYERWLLDAVEVARDNGSAVVAITDSVLSPLAAAAGQTFVVAAASAGPFDSHVGTLALLDLLVADTATALRSSATTRLDRLESAWQRADALTDD
jgi:DNA-binding MurR/RpiR family transcriptional regulator